VSETKISRKYKANPKLVSLVVLLIALPIFLNAVVITPQTVGDASNPASVAEICSSTTASSSLEEDSESCDDRTFRSEQPVFGWSLILHMIGGSMMMLSPAINLNSDILRRQRKVHRFSGYTFILGGVVAGSSALIMTLVSPDRFEPFNVFTNLLWGSLMLLFPLLAFRSIRKRDIASHQAWMIRAYAVAAGPAFHRIFSFLTPVIGDFGVSVLAVLLGELVIRKVRL
jgi:hypothetical protein